MVPGRRPQVTGGVQRLPCDVHGHIGNRGFRNLALVVEQEDVIVAGAGGPGSLIDLAIGSLVVEERVGGIHRCPGECDTLRFHLGLG